MKLQGSLLKMTSDLNNPVDYYLEFDEEKIHLNSLLGKPVSISFLNEIHCIKCGRKTNKSFQQGFCYPCFKTAPEADECIIKPELCLAHKGISRDMEWAEKHCLQNHFVYLAVSSGLKVGVTRESQVPTRWIDQGASHAIKIAKTPNRHTAGLIEVDLKKHFADKTNWRKMLTNNIDENINLIEERDKAFDVVKKGLKDYFITDNDIVSIQYPVLEYPEKVKSFSFDKEENIKKTLVGIKGQYLIFEENIVMNIRKHNGYKVSLEY